jgi:hypothetical protein
MKIKIEKNFLLEEIYRIKNRIQFNGKSLEKLEIKKTNTDIYL